MRALIAVALLVAGCSAPTPVTNAVDVAAAAEAARGDIDTYNAGALEAPPPRADVAPDAGTRPVRAGAGRERRSRRPDRTPPAALPSEPCGATKRTSVRADNPAGAIWRDGTGRDLGAPRRDDDSTAPRTSPKRCTGIR